MKKRRFLFPLLLLIFFSGRLPFWYTLRSYIFMPIYNLGVVNDSPLQQRNIHFYIPDGRHTTSQDWYPFMLHHNGSAAFSQHIGKPVSLDILYNFGHFDFWKGGSSFYNLSSPYCAGFYGGYAIFTQDSQWMYGFDQKGIPIIDELSKVPLFDQVHLVLPSVGLSADEGIFHYHVTNVQLHQRYIGHDDWVKIDADIETNVPIHQRDPMGLPGYYQYGLPHATWFQGASYPVIYLKGRTYARYFEEYKGTFFLYIMAKDEKTLEKCDQQLLSAASITHRKE